MGEARRRRMLLKPFPPTVADPDQPGHRFRCWNAKRPAPGAVCGCDIEERLERRSKARAFALLAAALSVPP